MRLQRGIFSPWNKCLADINTTIPVTNFTVCFRCHNTIFQATIHESFRFHILVWRIIPLPEVIVQLNPKMIRQLYPRAMILTSFPRE